MYLRTCQCVNAWVIHQCRRRPDIINCEWSDGARCHGARLDARLGATCSATNGERNTLAYIVDEDFMQNPQCNVEQGFVILCESDRYTYMYVYV